jgi:hypothetical protein
VRDLFDIFEDLPRVPRPSQRQRLQELRQRALVLRQRARASAARQQRAAIEAVSRRGRRS